MEKSGASPGPAAAYQAHPQRWGVLAVYGAASFMGALVWNILAPVYAIAEVRFQRGPQAINSLANAYYVWYCPGSIVALWMMERYGLRISLLTGFASQVVMIVMSVTGVHLPDPHVAYIVVWVGQVVGSFGQPLFLNNVARLAGDWFPINERDMAVTVSVVARSIGVMIISAAAPFVVRTPDQIPRLYDWQLPVWLVIAASSWWICQDKPPTPPSASAAHQWAVRAKIQAEPLPEGVSQNWAALYVAWADTKQLLVHANFMYLAISFSLLTGIGWTFLTIVGQLLEPCGYSNVIAGVANAVFMGANALGCFAAAPVVEATRAYVAMQRIFSWATAMTAIMVLGTAVPNATSAVFIAWAALGFSMGPLTPISFEHAAEMTYPLPANSSTSLLNVVSNLVGFIQTVIITPLLADRDSSTCSTVLTPAAFFTLFCAGFGLLFSLLVVKEYKRQAAEGVTPGDPWDCCVEEGYAARIKPGALPGPLPPVDEKAPLVPAQQLEPMSADTEKQA